MKVVLSNSVRGALLFSGGVCAGAVGAVLYSRHKYAADLDKAVEEVREHYRIQADRAPREVVLRESPYVPDAEDILAVAAALPGHTAYDKLGDAARAAGARASMAEARRMDAEEGVLGEDLGVGDGPEFEDDSDAEAVEIDTTTPDELVGVPGTGPEVISRGAFFEDYNGHQKLSITYYAEDGVLADDKDEPITNLAFTVGKDIVARFGELSEDPNIVYVRNYALEIDFEITMDLRSFAEVVYGTVKPRAVTRKRP